MPTCHPPTPCCASTVVQHYYCAICHYSSITFSCKCFQCAVSPSRYVKATCHHDVLVVSHKSCQPAQPDKSHYCTWLHINSHTEMRKPAGVGVSLVAVVHLHGSGHGTSSQMLLPFPSLYDLYQALLASCTCRKQYSVVSTFGMAYTELLQLLLLMNNTNVTTI